MRQVNGSGLVRLDQEELREISPESTRVQRKLLLKTIRALEATSQVSPWLGPAPECSCGIVPRTHLRPDLDCVLQNLSSTGALFRELNVWFPGKFRSIADTPLHENGDTIVVAAIHKVRVDAHFGRWR